MVLRRLGADEDPVLFFDEMYNYTAPDSKFCKALCPIGASRQSFFAPFRPSASSYATDEPRPGNRCSGKLVSLVLHDSDELARSGEKPAVAGPGASIQAQALRIKCFA